MDVSSNAYEERFVAFLDVLGFARLVEASVVHPDLATHVADVLSYAHKQLGAVKVSVVDGGEKRSADLRYTVFSDSIIVSSANYAPRALVIAVQSITRHFLFAGSLLRGGLSHGHVYHDKDLAFGPAIVGAYRLESEFAIYPRVVIDSGIVRTVRESMTIRSGVELVRTDRDGIAYLNPSIGEVKQTATQIAEYLKAIARSTVGARERMKVRWAIDEWNLCFKRLGLAELDSKDVEFDGSDLYVKVAELRSGR